MAHFNKILLISLSILIIGGFLIWPVTGVWAAAGSGLGGGSGSGLGGGSVDLPNPLGSSSFADLFNRIKDFLIGTPTAPGIIIILATLMVILAGFQFVTAQGSEEKIKKAKQNLIWTVTGLAVILLASALIDFIETLLGVQGATSTLQSRFKTAVNEIIGIIFALATVYFFWGVAEFVRAAGDQKKLEEGKKHMVWGIIGIVIMVGAWAIINLLGGFLGVY